MDVIRIGWGQVDITPDRSVYVVGQMYQRISRIVHDPLTATALALDDGAEHVVLVSLDMPEVPVGIMGELQKNLLVQEGLDFERISFHVTHTHNSTEFDDDFLRKDFESVLGKGPLPKTEIPEDLLFGAEAQAFLIEKLTELIGSAWGTRHPGGISAAAEYAVVGFNRRPVFRTMNGEETVMYGDCSEPGFRRFEGGTDSSVDLLYTWDPDGRLTGVLVDVPCPSQVYELHSFLSADFWAPTRTLVRERLGDIFVLPACGAAGDQNPLDLVRLSKHNKEALVEWGGQSKEVFRNIDLALECSKIGERITEAAVRGYSTARNTIDYRPAFRHDVMEIDLPLRLVSQDEYEASSRAVADIRDRYSESDPMTMEDLVRAFDPVGVILRWNLQNSTQVTRIQCHVLRIGTIAIATNPFELFSEYGMRMKARAKPDQVFVIQLANGIGGYLPTREAISGGSYSSRPASTLCGPESGDRLVEETLDILNRMWED